MSWYYDFYKIYKTKQEDVTLWNGRQSEDLPDHLRFLCEEYDDNDEHDGFEEIMEDILPINMYVEGKEYQGYLGKKRIQALSGKIETYRVLLLSIVKQFSKYKHCKNRVACFH